MKEQLAKTTIASKAAPHRLMPTTAKAVTLKPAPRSTAKLRSRSPDHPPPRKRLVLRGHFFNKDKGRRSLTLKTRTDSQTDYGKFCIELLHIHAKGFLKTAAGQKTFRDHARAQTLDKFAEELCNLYMPEHPPTTDEEDQASE
jgi:hypothetical protein